jgi:uncharacterized protein YfaS (alpha-2-macroglobulin family)
MVNNTYVSGNEIRLSVAFQTLDGNAIDPTAVELKVIDPDGDVTTYLPDAVVKDAVGHYHVDLTMDVAGRWYYRFEGSGAVTAAGEGSFTVNHSPFQSEA